ncbi:MAG: hypothetical protein Ta2E_00930 [Mycoplasmoidaceae bacterium]|nr:MAG: hypothetical protein Ta2E_00930 [Mycoplasmoidaceae bacterium]
MTPTTTTTIKSNYNNEIFTLGSYNGFSILIRDSDGYVNAPNLINNSNDNESITKELKNRSKLRVKAIRTWNFGW